MSAKSRQSLLRAKLAQQILSKAKGFTLIELLVVIVIVGVLSAIAIPQFLNQVRRSRAAEGQTALTAVSRASEAYRLDTSVYPDWENIDPNQCNRDDRAIPDYCGVNGDKFLNDPWEAITPIYKEPEFANEPGSQKGVRITTEADTGKGPAYVNLGNKPIKCEIGLGDQATEVQQNSQYFVGRSCNVFDAD